MNYNKPRCNILAGPTKNLMLSANNSRKISIQTPTVKRRIRPEPFKSDSSSDGFEQKIVKTLFLENLFGPSKISSRSRLRSENARDYECIVLKYEFKDSSMIFIPCYFDNIISKEYACRDCFRFYCLLSMKNRNLDPLPTFSLTQLNPRIDPRTLPHYCVHLNNFYPDAAYFNEFEPHLDNKCNVTLVDLSFRAGIFLKTAADIHRKVTNYVNATQPKSLQRLVKYIISLNSAIKSEDQAVSFIRCFSRYHASNKHPPLLKAEFNFQEILDEVNEESHDEVISWEQIASEGFEDEVDNKRLIKSLDPESRKTIVSSYRPTLQPKSNKHAKSFIRLNGSKTPPIPSDEQLMLTINRIIACTDVNVSADSFCTAMKNLKTMVLYYAPRRVSEFDRISEEILKNIKSSNKKL